MAENKNKLNLKEKHEKFGLFLIVFFKIINH